MVETTMNDPMKIELLVNMIPKFDGNKNSFYDFLDNCDLAQTLAQDSQKPTLLTFIKSKITGNARALIRNREFDFWSDLREHLAETYSDKRSASQYQLELNLCRQSYNEPVSHYAHRIENCLIKLTNSLDTTLTSVERQANVKLLRNQALSIFLTGLNRDLNIVVKSQKPQSLEDAISLAQAEEKEQKARYDIERFKYQKVNLRPYTQPQHSRPNTQPQYTRSYPQPQKQYSHNAFMHTLKSNQPFLNQSVKQCKYCKHMGHTIEECRKRQYNNNKRNLYASHQYPQQSSLQNQGNNPNSSHVVNKTPFTKN